MERRKKSNKLRSRENRLNNSRRWSMFLQGGEGKGMLRRKENLSRHGTSGKVRFERRKVIFESRGR
jgi:hypothetical protein